VIRVAILTISDSAIAGTRQDLSGPVLIDRCSELNWQVLETSLVPDDRSAISRQLTDWADSGTVSLILTTGGTGVAPRDVTPEATRAVLDREIPGIAELMRLRGLDQTRFSALSRAVAGSRRRALIVNLPGSPRGAVYSLKIIEDLIPHVVQLLEGDTQHEDSHDAKLSLAVETRRAGEASEN
jgi:molybdopterin adenylyltransferase